MSYYSVRIRESGSVKGIAGVYQGEMKYAGPALFLSAGVLEYTPWKQSRISFELGMKVRIANMKLPKQIVLSNDYNGNRAITSSLTSRSTGYYFPVIPEMTIGVEYRYR